MRKVIFIMFFIFPALLFLNSSFPTKLNKAKLNINGQLFYSDKIEYPGHPVSVWPSSHWPLKEVLDYINLTSSESENKVMIVREVDHFNSYTLEYYRYAKNFKFENFITKGSISDPFITPSIDTAYDQVNSADYAITILGQAANPTVTNKFDSQVTNDLIEGELPFKRVKNFYLPSGGVAAVFKKT